MKFFDNISSILAKLGSGYELSLTFTNLMLVVYK